jgi:YVTN family beta-propeller protein
MLALYRAGRQTDALDVYQDARRELVDELGLEPSPELQDLQRKILAHDATLAGPRRERVVRRRRGALMVVAGGAVLLAAGIAAGALELTGSSEAAGLSRIDANSVGVIDTGTNRIVAEVPVGSAPTRLALAGNSLWVVNTGDRPGTVSHVDVKRRVLIRTIGMPGDPSGVAANEKTAWFVYLRSRDTSGVGAGSAGAALVDPRFDDVTHTVALNQRFEHADDIALGLGSVWAADPAFVTRLGPSGRIRNVIPIDYTPQSSVAVGYGAVWANTGLGVVRIDPATNEITARIPSSQNGTVSGFSPTAVAAGEGAVWVANRSVAGNEFSTSKKPGSVTRIDPETKDVVISIPVGHEPFAIATGGGAVWVANRTDSTVMRIDPRTNKVVKTIKVGGTPEGLAADADELWVSVG